LGHPKALYEALIRLWPLGKFVYRLGSQPVVGALVRPLIDAAADEAVIIPVREAVQGTESVVLPYPVLTPLVERASARFIMNDCMCRRGENCQTYPQDFGCLFLGDGATKIDPALGRSASVNEAMAHVQQAMETGLVPIIVHAAFDSWVLGVPYRRTLSVCFCCDCCCAVHQGLKLGPRSFWDTVLRLPGLQVTVGPECVYCGACTDVCYVRAISLNNGRAHVGELCKGCGRCAAVCPTGAIKLRVADDGEILGRLLARIERQAHIGPKEQSAHSPDRTQMHAHQRS
jgi:UDP-glucose 4-epimerase